MPPSGPRVCRCSSKCWKCSRTRDGGAAPEPGMGWGVHRRWRDDGHEQPSEGKCARMKGKPSWQLLLIGRSRFPADQTHMQCGLKEGSGPRAQRRGQARLQGWRSGADRREVGHTPAVTGSLRRRGRKRQLSPPDSNTNSSVCPDKRPEKHHRKPKVTFKTAAASPRTFSRGRYDMSPYTSCFCPEARPNNHRQLIGRCYDGEHSCHSTIYQYPPQTNNASTLLYCSVLRMTPIKAFSTPEGRNRLKHREVPRGGRGEAGVQMSHIPLSYLLQATENN